MKRSFARTRGSCRFWLGALFCISSGLGGAIEAGTPAAPVARAPSQTHTSAAARKLPDWSGTWVLSDESWSEFFAAAIGQDGGRVPLTPRYLAIRNANAVTQTNNELKCIPMGTPDSMAIPV